MKILKNFPKIDIKNNNRHYKVILFNKLYLHIYNKLNIYFIEIHAIWMYFN